MPLSQGTRLGPYEVEAPLGAGGMGEVYKARDTRLGRTVAIKIAAEQFTERFEREARAVAALNHPNICALYDVGPNFLVMEYIQGPTLAERISAGAIPLEEALPLARQIAEALSAAHEKGIVHRDLKPANVKLTGTDGGQTAKVLDFGLAKAFEGEAVASNPGATPTLTLSPTRIGVILGTASYMSPEQARGAAVDKRTDIWAFGVVLLEMLTGRMVFAGETVSDTLASVLKTAPDWSALPAETPPAIRRLLRRAMERDRNKRLHDISDACLEIDEALAAPAEAPAATASVERPGRIRTLLPWAISALLLASTAWLALVLSRATAELSFQATLLPPDQAAFTPILPNAGGIAISPDGKTLAFVATQEGKTLLWARRLDSAAARPLPGTENAYFPFWSPDNRFLGFFADGKLKKIEVAGGPPQTVCESAGSSRGGSWNQEGTIVFAGGGMALQRVPAAGGQPVPATALDSANSGQWWPYFLPDGRHFLYAVRGAFSGQSTIFVGSLDSRPGSAPGLELVKASSNGIYAPWPDGIWPGHAGWLLFLRDTTLFGQKLDTDSLKLEGGAIPVAERVGYVRSSSVAKMAASESVLVYGLESSQRSRLIWLSRDGKESPIDAAPASYLTPRLSPDGSKLAVSIAESQTGNTDVWQIDLLHGTPTRFTFDPALDQFPLWSPDGKKIAFGSARGDGPNVYVKSANGVGNEQAIVPQSPLGLATYDWSRDGRYILYLVGGPSTGPDLWVLDLEERKARPFVNTAATESQGQFSPDGRWVAYSSDESGRYEIYVRSFPGTIAKFQVSNNGGGQPRWRGDGQEIYYATPDGKMMAVKVKPGAETFEKEAPRPLFESRVLAGISGSGPQGYLYDVTRDGQRFVVIERGESGTPPLTLVTNWQARLRK